MALSMKNKSSEVAEKEEPAKKKIKINKSKASTGTSKPHSLLKKGGAAKAALEKERALAKQRDADRDSGVFRFYLKPDQEKTITFLDGDLDEDGDLENICFYEHTINTKGYPKYVCINDPSEGVECPICATGDSQPYFATVFTVLVHESWHTKKEPDTIHECSIQLFVAKSGVADKLRKKAKKQGGLTGVTFEVSRSNAEAYNVGDDFEFVQKDDMQTLVDSFPEEVDKDGNSLIKVLDYEKVLNILSEDELKSLGYGTGSTAVGAESGVDEDSIL